MSVAEFCDGCGNECQGAQMFCKECSARHVPNVVGDWLERQRMKPNPPTREQIEFAEQCIEDLR